jgi:hypothetical protein
MSYIFFCVLVLLITRQVQSFFCEAAFYELSFFLVYWVHPSLGKCNLFLQSSVLWAIFFSCVLVLLVTRQVQLFFCEAAFYELSFFLVYKFRLSPGKCNLSFVKQRFMSYLFSLCIGSTCHHTSAIILLRSNVLWGIFFPYVLVPPVTRQVQSFFLRSSVLWVMFFPCVLVSPITRQVQSFFCETRQVQSFFYETAFYELSFFLVY